MNTNMDKTASCLRGITPPKHPMDCDRSQQVHRMRGSTIVVAEFRDEVYARLEADLRAIGHHVHRAVCADEVWAECCQTDVGLAIINVQMQRESGWVVAAKLRLVFIDLLIWVYTPAVSTGVSLAEFFGVDRRVEYGGDLWILSRKILDLIRTLPLSEVRH